MNRVTEWFFDSGFNWLIGALLLLIIGATALDAHKKSQEREAFMTECLKERKQYECTALWRAGSRTVVPMPIIVPAIR